jgi:hypothetical protein
MNTKELKTLFEKYDDEYIEFDRVQNPLHPCPDVCAFILLNKLVPLQRGQDMVSWSEHDEIGFFVDPTALAKAASEDDILTLVRCGVRYDDGSDSFKMFV